MRVLTGSLPYPTPPPSPELTGETSDCSSTLPESFSDVTLCNSTVTRQPPLPFPHG